MIMETKHVLAAMAALAQETRLAAYRLLVQAGPAGMSPGKIAEQLGIPASSLSFHLKELAHAQLIVPTQDGRYILYAADFSTMAQLIAFLTENCCGGNPCSAACAPCAEPAP